MVETCLEANVRRLIEDVYCCICNIPIKAKVLDDTYIIYLYVHGLESHPVHMIWEGDSECEFFNWLKQELKERNLIRSSHININLNHDE